MKNQEANKEELESAGRISKFLNIWFGAIAALEVGFSITKDNNIIISDLNTGLSSTFTPERFQEIYKKWAKENAIEE